MPNRRTVFWGAGRSLLGKNVVILTSDVDTYAQHD